MHPAGINTLFRLKKLKYNLVVIKVFANIISYHFVGYAWDLKIYSLPIDMLACG